MKTRFAAALFVVFLSQLVFSKQIPITGRDGSGKNLITTPTDALLNFLGASPDKHPSPEILRAVVKDIFSFQVVEQPNNQPGFVSHAENTLTRFRLADEYDSIGLLAHNHLAGSKFLELTLGDQIDLYLDQQKYDSYWVISIRRFQALSASSPYSEFIDLHSGLKYSSADLFLEIYGNPDMLILQTCLNKGEIDSWGRIFVIAQPYSPRFYRPWIQGVNTSLFH